MAPRKDIIDLIESFDTGKTATIQPSGTEYKMWFLHLYDDDGDLVATEGYEDLETAKINGALWIMPEDYDEMH